jgi:hypothetical protein
VGIDQSGTGSHTTEVHILCGSTFFQNYLFETGTALGETGSNWQFLVTDWNGDGLPDLVGVEKYGTGTSSTEVHILQIDDWFDRNLRDPGVATQARQMYTRDGSLTRNDMLGLFNLVESDGVVSANELASLRAIVAGAADLNISDYVRVLANGVVNSDPANAHYQGAALGNLYAGSSSGQLQELVNKWFLGRDRPSVPQAWYKDALGNTVLGIPPYQQVTGVPLFPRNSVSPSYTDVQQGAVGDCWLLASLAEIAARSPAVIQTMFIDNGDGTYTVRYFHDGVRDYVTVDNYLPGGGSAFDQPQGDLWVALAEKAYAQANESGYIGTSNRGSNCYQALNSGWPSWALSALSCLPTASTGGFTATSLVTDWQSGKLIALDTSDMGNSPKAINGVNLVSLHSYAVVNYNPVSQQFTVFNPWGSGGGTETLPNNTSVFCGGTVTGTGSQLAASFTAADETGSAAALFAEGGVPAATAGDWTRYAPEDSHGGSTSTGLRPVSPAAARDQPQDRVQRLAIDSAPLSQAVPSDKAFGTITTSGAERQIHYHTHNPQDLAGLLFARGGREFGWESALSPYLLPD